MRKRGRVRESDLTRMLRTFEPANAGDHVVKHRSAESQPLEVTEHDEARNAMAEGGRRPPEMPPLARFADSIARNGFDAFWKCDLDLSTVEEHDLRYPGRRETRDR
jgi:hypothetical protein